MTSRFEKLVTALTNGESVDFEPQSRIEQCLKNCCDQCGCDGLPEPQSRSEILLHQLAEKLEGGVIQVMASEADMNAMLDTGKVGEIYKYTGETTDTYENGALYLLENE